MDMDFVRKRITELRMLRGKTLGTAKTTSTTSSPATLSLQ